MITTVIIVICAQLHIEICVSSTNSRQHPSHDSSLSCVQVGLLNKDKVSHLHSLCVQMTVLCKVSISLPCKKTSPGTGPGEALAWDEASGGCSTSWFGWFLHTFLFHAWVCIVAFAICVHHPTPVRLPGLDRLLALELLCVCGLACAAMCCAMSVVLTPVCWRQSNGYLVARHLPCCPAVCRALSVVLTPVAGAKATDIWWPGICRAAPPCVVRCLLF